MGTPGDTPTPGGLGSGNGDALRRSISSLPRLNAEEIRSRAFKRATRGVSEAEVRNFLHRVAEELEAARRREEELERTVRDLEEELATPPPVTEEQLLDSLGEETARVLRTAQQAANEIRSKGETLANGIVEEAENTERRLREEVDAFVAGRREEGEQLATRLREDAETRATELRDDAERTANAIRERAEHEATDAVEGAREEGREMVQQAKVVRERVLTDLARRRRSLRDQLQELRSGRARLLEGYRVVRRTLTEATEALGGPASAGPDLDLDALAADEAELTDTEIEAVLAEAEAMNEQSLDSEPTPIVITDDDVGVDREVDAQIDAQSDAPSDERRDDAGETPDAGPGAPSTTPDAEAVPPGRGLRNYVKGAFGLGGSAPGAGENGGDAERSAPPDPGAVFAKLRAAKTDEPAASAPDDAATPMRASETTNEEGEAGEHDDPEPIELTGDVALRAERDDALAAVEADLARTVKRALQDEQNELLDALRRAKRRKDVTALVPELDEVVTRWAEAMSDPLAEAYGARPSAELASELARALVAPLHDRVMAAVAQGGDADELTAKVGARYREWRSQELAPGIAEAAATAHSRGVFDRVAKMSRLRWVPARPGRCPDCDDNALETTERGKPFPTGQPHPPAHPGCRCLLVVEP